MAQQGAFAARVAERILRAAEVDAAVFSEPIGGNDRPLMSPRMYEEFVLRHYAPLRDVLRARGVRHLIFLTFANVRPLIPSLLAWGFDCLWATEASIADMDYRALRRAYGKELNLIGGIDMEALRRGRRAIEREVREKVPPLLADGGYIPLAAGRLREDVPFDHYAFYRRLLSRVVEGS
jgi:uroporphyrinogen decarboxylase